MYGNRWPDISAHPVSGLTTNLERPPTGSTAGVEEESPARCTDKRWHMNLAFPVSSDDDGEWFATKDQLISLIFRPTPLSAPVHQDSELVSIDDVLEFLVVFGHSQPSGRFSWESKSRRFRVLPFWEFRRSCRGDIDYAESAGTACECRCSSRLVGLHFGWS